MLNQRELLFVVDEKNKPIKSKSRKETHAKGYWHRTSHIWIINQKNEILCQKRSQQKDINPGKWESFFGGHIHANQEYTEGAIQELREELNIHILKGQLIFFKIEKAEKVKEFQAVYYILWNGSIAKLEYEKEEVDTIKWLSSKKVIQVLEEKNIVWSIPSYTKQITSLLEKLTEKQRNIDSESSK